MSQILKLYDKHIHDRYNDLINSDKNKENFDNNDL